MMAGPTAREYLVAQLTPALPRFWNLIDTQRSIDTIERITVQVKQLGFKKVRSNGAPQLLVDFVVTIVSPKKDFAAAERQLDDNTLKLAAALIVANNVIFQEARKVTVGPDDRYLGYDLTIQVLDQQGVTP